MCRVGSSPRPQLSAGRPIFLLIIIVFWDSSLLPNFLSSPDSTASTASVVSTLYTPLPLNGLLAPPAAPTRPPAGSGSSFSRCFAKAFVSSLFTTSTSCWLVHFHPNNRPTFILLRLRLVDTMMLFTCPDQLASSCLSKPVTPDSITSDL